MGLLAALLLCAVDPGAGQSPEPRPQSPQIGLAAELGLDTQWLPSGRIDNVAFWGELEFGFRPLPWLRLDVIAGAAWSPENRPSYPGQHGTFRVLTGLDFISPFRWGDLFLGVAGGIQHTNLFGDEDYPAHAGYSTPWSSGLCLLGRAGVDFRVLKNFSVGGELAYSLFLRLSDAQHSAEVRARFTILLGP